MSDLDRLDALKLRSDAQSTRFGAPYAEALRREGRLDEAVRIIRSTLETRPRNVFGLVVLARCLRDLGHPEEAGVAVGEARSLDASDPTVTELDYLVGFALRLTPPDDVAPTAPPPVFVTETMAELYLQQGLPDRALAIYRELTARVPEDARLAARLAEVSAQADAGTVERVVERPSEAIDALVDLPLLDDFDPSPWSMDELSEPERVGLEPFEPSAFDFSHDAERAAEPLDAEGEAMLAGLSFEAIALPTPSVAGEGLALPERAGPSAREALRALASRPATVRPGSRPPVTPPAPPLAARPAGRRTTTGIASPTRVAPPASADAFGDDFDQWLRGVR